MRRSLIVVGRPRRKPRKRKLSSKHGYTERNKNLLAIGFGSYWEYLNSDMWKIIRAMVFETKGRKCVSCSSAASQVHHAAYDMETLVGSNLERLHPVCKSCHEAAEIDAGVKRHKDEANKTLGVEGLTDKEERRSRSREAAIENTRKQMKKVPKEIRAEIVRRFGRGKNGESMRNLASSFGLPKNVVRMILGWKIR